MSTFCLVGSTGLVGNNILGTLCKRPEVNVLYAFSRRDLPLSDNIKSIRSDSSTWAQQYPAGVAVFISGLGTTRAAAGGFDAQYRIDHDLNLELATAAKHAGTRVYVLISSSGANSSSLFGYPKMKGKLEDEVKALDFDHTVVLRPGLIVGERSSYDSRTAEYVLRKTAELAGSVSNKLKDFWAQDAEVIGKAAVRAALDCLEGRQKQKVVVLSQAGKSRISKRERYKH
ncbi:NAD dependent epimerase/dehydratase family protein-like protein [Neohortaea acidophila]|uniref:NAD dependent epimerase/dehydratase family protein-like protein n=1 Tax=Neohortaea acidophila TaxID=245834 RepID=A0A6A6Q0B9_9PEZI|nr:NAD dependent epimerase/dehydratase family protein-like protein [Neohortaea acidophila]KAF2485436.1 NAD dependent epimerase/dehydratase family protein-like protein [Neohortaea acidophila]